MSRDFAAYAKSTYGWKPGHEKHLRITKTSLTSDFDFCPKQYEYKRIHRLPEPTTDAMTKGTNVHDAVEVYYDNVIPLVNQIHKCLVEDRRTEAMELALSALPEPEEPYELGEEDVLFNRISWDLDRLLIEGPDKYLPIINELELHVFRDETIEFNGETITVPVHYAGMIDRGYHTEENSVALMELKTGKWVQTKKGDDWEDSKFKLQSMRTEMAYYKDLLEMADHPYANVTHWGWVYPAGGLVEVEALNKYGYEQRSINRIFYEPCTGRTNTTYKRKLRRMKDALLTAYLTEDFPTKPSQGKCAWCSFKSICPSWDGSDDPEEYLRNYKTGEEE